MATDNKNKQKNKSMLARFIKLDNLLRSPIGMTINELLAEIDDDITIRQLKNNLTELQKEFGAIFDSKASRGRQRLWRYADSDFTIVPQISQDMEIIRKTIAKLDLLKGDPRYDMLKFYLIRLQKGVNENEAQLMSFDNNIDVCGLDFIEDILNAIVNQYPLRMTYKPFHASEFVSNIHPYHLRQYNRRWYVFAYSEEKQEIRNYALDRILELKHLSKPYIPTDIDFDEYFDDIIGVTNYKQNDVEEVILKIDKKSYDYIRTKPLHWTQTERKDMETESHVFIQLKVKMNTELEMLICSYGDAVEVIEPVSLREAIFRKVEKMYNQYKV